MAGAAGSSRNPPHDSQPKPGVNDSGPKTPKVDRGRRSSEGGTPQNVTPLGTPNPGERVTPIQGQTTPSTPFSAHVGRPIHTVPRITGLSPDYAPEGRGRSVAVNGDSPYLQRARNARSSEPGSGRLRSPEPADSLQLPDFVSPTGHVPRPTQERRPRAQRSQDAGRHGSEPLPDKRSQRKSLPQPAGGLDPLWDQFAATIGALPGIAPQSTDKLHQALKNGADRKSLRASFDSMLREILAARPAVSDAPGASGPQAGAAVPQPLAPLDTADSRWLSLDLLPWPASPPLDAQSPGESPIASPEPPALATDLARKNATPGSALSPDPRSPLISPEIHDFARNRFHALKRGPFSRPPEPEPMQIGRSACGQGGKESESDDEGESGIPNCHASFAVSPSQDRNISAMSAPIAVTRSAISGKQVTGSSGNRNPGLATDRPLRMSVSPGAPRSPLTSPEARRSSAVRRNSSPEMAGFRQDRSVAMLGHWNGLMSALKLNSVFRTQAVAQASSAFCAVLESRHPGQAALNAGFGELLDAIKNSQGGFQATPQVTPSRREIGSPVRDARGDMEGRFSGIQDGNLGLHLRKLAAEIESLPARPRLENRADFRQATEALIQWIKNQ
jgi:hypothetical protein